MAMDEDYAKLMDDLERQDRLLLMVTDKLADTIEELKLAYAAKDSNSTNNSTTSLSPATSPSSASSSTCICNTVNMAPNKSNQEQGTVNTNNEYANEQATNQLSPVRESRNNGYRETYIGEDSTQQHPMSEIDEQPRRNIEYANKQATNTISLVSESKNKIYRETFIGEDIMQQHPMYEKDGKPRDKSRGSRQNCVGQEWTVTLTDGTGKSRPARSVSKK